MDRAAALLAFAPSEVYQRTALGQSPPLAHFDRAMPSPRRAWLARLIGRCLRVSIRDRLTTAPKSSSNLPGVSHLVRASPLCTNLDCSRSSAETSSEAT
jgi:hypothetical protein